MYADLSPEKFLKKLAGQKDIEDALRRLDRLTQEEALMAAAQILNLAHTIDNKVMGVGSKMNVVDDKMDVVINGMPDLSVFHHLILIARMLVRCKGCKGGSG